MSILDVETISPRDPERIRLRTFARVRKGYDPNQVHEYLGRVAEIVQDLLDEMDELRERAEGAQAAPAPAPAPAMQAEATETPEPRDPFGELGAHVAEVLRTAEQHAERLRAETDEQSKKAISEARQEAARVRQVAQQDADALRERAEEDAERIRASASEALDAARGEAERMLTGLAQRRHHLVSELHSTRERLVTIVDQLQRAVEEDVPATAARLLGTDEALVIPEDGMEDGTAAPGTRNGNGVGAGGSWPATPQPPRPPEDIRAIWPTDPFASDDELPRIGDPVVPAPPKTAASPPKTASSQKPPAAASEPSSGTNPPGPARAEPWQRPARPDLDDDKFDELLQGASTINLVLPEIPAFEEEPEDDDDRP